MNYKAIVSVMAITMSGLAAADLPVCPKAPASYCLTYRVQEIPLSKEGKPKNGSFSLAERDGKLLMKFTASDGAHTILAFDGKRTFVSSADASAQLYEGAYMALPGFRIYFPFNFNCYDVYSRLNNNKFANVKLSGVLPGQKFNIGGTMQPLGTGPEGPKTLIVGASTAPGLTEEFLSPVNENGFEVPSQMVLTDYRQQKDSKTGGVSSTPEHRITLTLTSSSDVYEKNPGLDFRKELSQGMLVSYSGDDGDAGVAFDSQKGSFDDQLKSQMQIRKRHQGQVNPSSSSLPWVPTILAVVFGSIAILALSVKKRKA